MQTGLTCFRHDQSRLQEELVKVGIHGGACRQYGVLFIIIIIIIIIIISSSIIIIIFYFFFIIIIFFFWYYSPWWTIFVALRPNARHSLILEVF
jgi:Flp pilus assembly protein TadB